MHLLQIDFGIYSLKWQLEDLSFKYLNMEEYNEILMGVNKKRSESLQFLDKIQNEIQTNLKKQKIVAQITGREKHIYSISRKMKRSGSTLDQIYDLFALRIIVNSIKDCYGALGVVHELYNPMPGRFKDYIAVPKANMYQSLHTTLIGEKAIPFEVQIRTWDMHKVAEFGIAAHWAYKEASFRFGKKANVKVEEDKLAWLRETLEWQSDMQNPQEFLNTLKTELFEDEVYVFTPKGDIKMLPKGSTPIDYAYNIHAEIGNRMVGAKINSKMMPIITELKNGDIIEIITSDNAKGPSRDWLKFVKSTQARNKINAWFKKELKSQNYERGKDAIDKEIKRLGLNGEEVLKPEFINAALKRYHYEDVDDMYAAIGYGAITSGKIINKILDEYAKTNDDADKIVREKLEELSKIKNVPKQNQSSSNGIIVRGIENCLVKFSECCNPVPGDEIVGYITRGKGVSVHRKDCPNLNSLFQDSESRMIDVEWMGGSKTSYKVDIDIYSNDREGLLADIIANLNAEKAKILNINANVNQKERIVTTELTLDVEDIDELNKCIKAIRKVDSVYEVKRKK